MQAPKPVYGHNVGESTSTSPLKWMQTHSAAKASSFAMPMPLQEKVVRSSSDILPYHFNLEKDEFGKEKATVSPIISKSSIVFKQLPNANLIVLEHEQFREHEMIFEKKRDCQVETRNDSLQKLHNRVHDVETKRFSQTTRSLLIMKKRDVTLSKEDIFRSEKVITSIDGGRPSNLHHCLSPFFGQGKSRVKLQALSSSTDSDGKEYIRDVKSSKDAPNESSAETDIMDLDPSTEKSSYSSAYSTPSTKALNINSALPLRTDHSSSRETVHRWPNIMLPDINLELPLLAENACASSSRTQSLEIDKLLGNHAVLPRPKSKLSLNDSSNATDPANRWVKRLKLNLSNSSAQGTKSSSLVQNLSHDKMSKYFSRILKSSITSSDMRPREHSVKESMPPLSKKLLEKRKKGKKLLSNAWIQRWLSNRSRITDQNKPDVVCEPQSSKLALENLQKELFPSIAAVALMRKAITGFQQCELQKRGPFTVWKTKVF